MIPCVHALDVDHFAAIPTITNQSPSLLLLCLRRLLRIGPYDEVLLAAIAVLSFKRIIPESWASFF